MKKSLILILSLMVALSFSLTACGENGDSVEGSGNSVQDELSVDMNDEPLSVDPGELSSDPEVEPDIQSTDEPEVPVTPSSDTGQSSTQTAKSDSQASTPSQSKTSQKPAQQPSKTQTSSQSSQSAQPAQTTQPETTQTQAPSKATAQSYIGKSASALIAAIGSPLSSDYSSSCLGDGEDGELHYDGFTVYTYRENGQERVEDVE